jgi:hypothetical protein
MMMCILVRCRKPYDPPAIKASNHFLAVDGVINTGANSSSRFVLSRSRNLQDSVTDLPELGAQFYIQNTSGASFPLIDTGGNGIYVSAPLNLDPNQQYHVSVTTIDGNKYASDAVSPKSSPAIDSLNWELAHDASLGSDVVNIYVNSHDPANNTHYYRWDYIETWEHHSTYQSFWGLKDNLEHGLFPSETTYYCWSTGFSTSIILGTSITLSADVISQAKIATFAKDDPRMDIKYSVLVRQYPLDFEAYNYWLNVQRNSQSLGGLFDVQPAQLNGNIHSVTNPKDPVFGYITASSVSEQRIFISNNSLPGWQSNPPINCPIKIIGPPDPNNTLYWSYPDTSFQLYYYSSGAMVITRKECLDCRYQGGTIVAPAFWQ